MQVVIDNKSSSPLFDKWLDRALFDLYKGVLRCNDGVFNFFKGILGFIGLVIAIPILFLLSLTGWIFMLSLNYRMERDLTEYHTLINSWDDRKKMEEHLSLERLLLKLNGLMSRANNQKFIINPVTKQAFIFVENLSQMEKTLKKVAYPDLNRPSSQEETEYLLSVFENFDCQDWKHESAFSYED